MDTGKVSNINNEQSHVKNEQISENNSYNSIFIQSNWPMELQKLGFKAKYIKLDEDLLSFLDEDGIYIHPKYLKNPEGIDDLDERFRVFSQEFEDTVRETLEEYGSIFVKLNDRAPRDIENWLHRLQIYSMEELLTGLKSSGILTELLEDIPKKIDEEKENQQEEQAKIASEQKNQEINLDDDDDLEGIKKESLRVIPIILVLKKWYDLKENMIVRCFVRDNQLIGMCQRHCSSVNHTLDNPQFSQSIITFFEQKLKPNWTSCERYVFDVYIDIAPAHKIRLIDINPWGNHTNPLLFKTWEALEALDIPKNLQILTVANDDDAIIEDLSAYRVPEDILDHNSEDIFDHLNLHNKDLYQ